MSSFRVRLKELRLEEHLTQAELASIIGISKSTISMYENGNREPDFETLESFADYFNVDMNYLTGYSDDPVDYDNYDGYIPEQFNGDVKRFFEFQKAVDQDAMEEQHEFDAFLQTVSPSEREGLEKYRSLDPYGQETVSYILDRESNRVEALQKKDKHIKKLESRPTAIIGINSSSSDQLRFIDYFRSVSAGTGQVIFDDVYSERIQIPDIPKYRRVAYAVKVDGSSMEPLYSNGDILLIEPTCEINVKEIGIFNVNGQAYVKQLGEDKLISLNKGYKDIPLTEDSLCMGRVVDKL